jgi:hypothetical protein
VTRGRLLPAALGVLTLQPREPELRLLHHYDTARIREYIAARQSAGASNGTVIRKLAALKRAYTLAMQARKIALRL